MATDVLGKVTITYNGPGDVSLDPPTGKLNRDVQTMTWTLVDNSGLNAKFKNPTGGIVFMPGDTAKGTSKWAPPGSQPTGNATVYTAGANDKIPHGNSAKLYEYDIVIERKSTGDNPDPSATEEETISIRLRSGESIAPVPEIVDPPIENEPQP